MGDVPNIRGSVATETWEAEIIWEDETEGVFMFDFIVIPVSVEKKEEKPDE